MQRAFHRAKAPAAGKFSLKTLQSASQRPARSFLGAYLGKLRHSSVVSHPQVPPATWLCFLGENSKRSATERSARARGRGTARRNGQEGRAGCLAPGRRAGKSRSEEGPGKRRGQRDRGGQASTSLPTQARGCLFPG